MPGENPSKILAQPGVNAAPNPLLPGSADLAAAGDPTAARSSAGFNHVEGLAFAVEAAKVGNWEWDLVANQLSFSSRCKQHFGFAPDDEVSYARFLDAVHPEDREGVDNAVNTAIAQCKDYDVEMRTVWPDGSVHWINSLGRAYYSDTGEPIRMLGVTRDVTERRTVQEAQQRLAAIVQASDDAIVSKSLDGTIQTWNTAAERMFGYTAHEAVGQSITILLPPECADEEDNILNELKAGRTLDHFETTRVTKDGRRLYVSLSVSPIRDTEGRLVGASKILRDVTRRKQDEERLRQSEERFHTLADNMSQLAWMADVNGALFWYNQRWYEYTGTTFEQMQGWGWERVHHPDHLLRVKEKYLAALASGQPWEDTFPLRSRYGAYRWFLSRAVPIRDQQGNIVRWFGTNTDVTEEKQQEEELRRSQQQLQLAVEVADLGEWELDLSANTASRSQRHAEIFGDDPASPWSLERYLEFVLPEQREEVMANLSSCRKTGMLDYETRIRRVDGEVRWIWLRGRLRKNEQGQEHVFGTVVDITERKLAEQALIRSEKLASAGRMAATVAHEINNPLESVTNLLFLAKISPDTPEEVKSYLDKAGEELDRIATITRQSLGFYRESSAMTRISLGKLLDSAIEVQRTRIVKKHATVDRAWTEDIEVTAVASELRQVFSNLLANSLDAIADGGRVRLRLTSGPSHQGKRTARIVIADNGTGISDSIQRHIFEPFYTTKGEAGTGLGLWVTKQIVENHGGTIRVRSRTEGKCRGTLFSLTLPVEPDAVADGNPPLPGAM